MEETSRNIIWKSETYSYPYDARTGLLMVSFKLIKMLIIAFHAGLTNMEYILDGLLQGVSKRSNSQLLRRLRLKTLIDSFFFNGLNSLLRAYISVIVYFYLDMRIMK